MTIYNQELTKNLIFFVEGLLVLGCLVLIFILYQQSKHQQSATIIPSQSAKDVLYALQNNLQIKVDIPTWLYDQEWIENDKQKFFVWGSQFDMRRIR